MLPVFDTIVIVSLILLKGWPNVAESSNHIFAFTMAHPIMNCSYMMSIYLTVLMTLERFHAVCLKGMAKRQSNKKRIKLTLVLTLAIVVSFNLPKFLEYTLKSSYIRTDYDLDESILTSAVNRLPDWKRRSYFDYDYTSPNKKPDHLAFLQSYQEIAESGADNDGEFVSYLLICRGNIVIYEINNHIFFRAIVAVQ